MRFESLRIPTTIDGLTQVFSKSYFLEALEREIGRSTSEGSALSLVMCDIDHLKAINDTCGHLAGDYVLQQVAQRIAANIRQGDTLARYGGEEFTLILPGLDRAQAAQLAEVLRLAIEGSPLVFEQATIRVTISAGVADLGELMQRMRVIEAEGSRIRMSHHLALTGLVDDRLFDAKRAGRNRVV